MDSFGEQMNINPQFTAGEDFNRFFNELAELVASLNRLGELLQVTETTQSFITTEHLLRNANFQAQLTPLGISSLIRLNDYLAVNCFDRYTVDFGPLQSPWGSYQGGGPISPNSLLSVPVDGRGEDISPNQSDVEPMSPPLTNEWECPCMKPGSQETTARLCGAKCRSIEELVRHMSKTHAGFYLWMCGGNKLWPELHRLKKHFCLKRRAQNRCYCTETTCIDPSHDQAIVAKTRMVTRIKDISNRITPAQRAQGYRERHIVAKKRVVDRDLLMRLMAEGKGEEELAEKCLTDWETVRVDFKYAQAEGAGGS